MLFGRYKLTPWRSILCTCSSPYYSLKTVAANFFETLVPAYQFTRLHVANLKYICIYIMSHLPPVPLWEQQFHKIKIQMHSYPLIHGSQVELKLRQLFLTSDIWRTLCAQVRSLLSLCARVRRPHAQGYDICPPFTVWLSCDKGI
jgi:hypothetical protein